jgi:hypothetical protein
MQPENRLLGLLIITLILTGIIFFIGSAPVWAKSSIFTAPAIRLSQPNIPDHLNDPQFQEDIGSTDVVTYYTYLPIIHNSPTGWQAPLTSGTTNLLNGVGCSGSACVAGGPNLSVYTDDGSNWTAVHRVYQTLLCTM